MPKLIVAGCSVSDYTNVNKVWGEYLADQLGYEYLHEAAGCGSNYRIWRVLASHIRKNIITPDDTVVVQYTTLERNEFWSPSDSTVEPRHHRDEYDNGSLIRYKVDSHNWHFGYESKLMKIYDRFINLKYEEEKFINNHLMFQCLMKEYKIKNLYFVKVGGYGQESLTLLDCYKDNYKVCQNIFDNHQNHLLNDSCHLSSTGHKLLADIIFNKIKSE